MKELNAFSKLLALGAGKPVLAVLALAELLDMFEMVVAPDRDIPLFVYPTIELF